MPDDRKPYPSDVFDEERLILRRSLLGSGSRGRPQRTHEPREVSNALRWIVRAGASWRMLPHAFPPWEAVCQRTRRWLTAGVFEARGHDLRAVLRLASGRAPEPTAAILDSRMLCPSPESGHRAGYDGAKREKGSKVRTAVDTSGHLLALHVTPADEQDRAQANEPTEAVREATGESVEQAYVDQGYAGEEAAEAAEHGIRLEVVKRPEAQRGFMLLLRRWVVERDLAWAKRFGRLVKDYERLPTTVAGPHFVAFACLLLEPSGRLARFEFITPSRLDACFRWWVKRAIHLLAKPNL